jgi:hypothetical protein
MMSTVESGFLGQGNGVNGSLIGEGATKARPTEDEPDASLRAHAASAAVMTQKPERLASETIFRSSAIRPL